MFRFRPEADRTAARCRCRNQGHSCVDLLEPRREQMDNFEANRMTRNHQDDARLIAALDAALAQSPASPVPGDDLMNPIIEAMESHPKFRNELTRCFGSKWLLLNPRSQAYNLPKIAFERGPSAAVAWCHKVYSTERADLRYVSEVYGLHDRATAQIEQRRVSNALREFTPFGKCRGSSITISKQFA